MRNISNYYGNIFALIPAIVVDTAGRVKLINDPFASYFSIDLEDFSGISVEEIFPTPNYNQSLNKFLQGCDSPKPCHFKWEFNYNNKRINCEVQLSSFNSPDTEENLILILFHGLPENKLDLNSLLDSHAYLSVLLNNTHDFIMICDQQALPVIYNKAYARAVKLSFDCKITTDIHPCKLFEDQSIVNKWTEYHRRVLSGEHLLKRISYDFNNEFRHFEVSYNPIEVDGIIRGFCEIVRDITTRVRAEEALKAAHHILEDRVKQRTKKLTEINALLEQEIEERKEAELALVETEINYRGMIGNSPDMILLQDPDGTITFVNSNSEDIIGLKPENVIGRELIDFVHKDDLEKVSVAMEDLFAGQRIVNLEYRVNNSGGEICWVSHTGRPLVYNDELSAVQSNVRDITVQRQANNTLLKIDKELTKSNIQLNDKNVALQELLQQVEYQKSKIVHNVQANINTLVNPLINTLAGRLDASDRTIVDLIKHNLNAITSSVTPPNNDKLTMLSPRELEICNMIKQGMNSKDIAKSLNISVVTVTTHRNNIRKKLNIKNTGDNLVAHLNSL